MDKNTNKRPKQSMKTVIGNTKYMLSLVWEVGKESFIFQLISYLIGNINWALDSSVLTRYLFGQTELNMAFKSVALILICFYSLYLIDFIIDQCYNRFAYKFSHILNYRLNMKLFEKAKNVDMSCYENSEFYNTYTKASEEIFWRTRNFIWSFSQMLGALVAFSIVVVNLFCVNFWFGMLSLVPIASQFIFGALENKLSYEKDMEMVPDRRRQSYVNRAFYLQKFAKEVRLTNVSEVLFRSYDESTNSIMGIISKYTKRLAAVKLPKFTLSFSLLFEGGWLLGVLFAMVLKMITVSDFVVVSASLVSMTWMMNRLSFSINKIIECSLYIKNLKTFVEHDVKIPEDSKGKDVPKKVESIEIKNVSFKYDGTDKYVLKNLNMVLPAGKITSLVGNNGSGKSTLVKLLMRLYDPVSGEILLNGVNIKEYNLKQYRKLIGATFQDFQMFSMSVEDNVIMGNDIVGEHHDVAIDSLKKSVAYDNIMELEHGEYTTLTKEFDDDGIVLSVGQAQKVAIARAFAKKSSILLLDEPSSALDPIAEHTMFENFKQLCLGDDKNKKISVFISHRLSSSTIASYIYLLENGEITEEGTHEELMKKNGKYHELFSKQAENYLIND